MTDEVKEQILEVRDTGKTNMFDMNAVQKIAYDLGCYELVTYIEEHRQGGYRFDGKEYSNFILYGE